MIKNTKFYTLEKNKRIKDKKKYKKLNSFEFTKIQRSEEKIKFKARFKLKYFLFKNKIILLTCRF